MAEMHVNPTYKDSLFRMIFREKKELLELYNAINGSDFDDPEELEIRTIDDVLYMGMKNDCVFLIDDYLNLYEAQGSYNPNMPLRGLFYFAGTYRGYVEEKKLDIYSRTRLPLPTPKYIVFYNGLREVEDVRMLKLSDSFRKQTDGEPVIECVATMLNVNYGHNEEIMRKCRKLYEYSYLIKEIRKNLQAGFILEAAVDAAVETCIEEGILTDFLRKHRAEVKDMIMPEYDEKLHIANEKALSFQEGEQKGKMEGKKEGRKQGIESIRKLNRILLEQKRYDDLERISKDDEYLDVLLKELVGEKW